MMRGIISAALSVGISLCLLSGHAALSQFGFSVSLIINVLAWIGLLAAAIDEEVSKNIRRGYWLNLPATVLALYALIFTGHELLAASSFMSSMLTSVVAFRRHLA